LPGNSGPALAAGAGMLFRTAHLRT
jgi:hypothetical protein